MLAAEDRQQEAIVQLEKAVNLKPDLYEAQLALAMILAKAGRNPEARAHCIRAVQSPDAELRRNAQTLLRELGG